jgi:hypothetical protein
MPLAANKEDGASFQISRRLDVAQRGAALPRSQVVLDAHIPVATHSEANRNA